MGVLKVDYNLLHLKEGGLEAKLEQLVQQQVLHAEPHVPRGPHRPRAPHHVASLISPSRRTRRCSAHSAIRWETVPEEFSDANDVVVILYFFDCHIPYYLRMI